jgi:hypothetical protein
MAWMRGAEMIPHILTLTALTVFALLAWRWLRMRRMRARVLRRPVRVVREAEAVAAVYWPTEGGA